MHIVVDAILESKPPICTYGIIQVFEEKFILNGYGGINTREFEMLPRCDICNFHHYRGGELNGDSSLPVNSLNQIANLESLIFPTIVGSMDDNSGESSSGLAATITSKLQSSRTMLFYASTGVNDKIVTAFCEAIYSRSGTISICTLATLPDYRGRNIAKRLVGNALRFGKKFERSNFARLDCRVEINGNFDGSAIEFYKKLGFEVVGGEKKKFYGDGSSAFSMELGDLSNVKKFKEGESTREK